MNRLMHNRLFIQLLSVHCAHAFIDLERAVTQSADGFRHETHVAIDAVVTAILSLLIDGLLSKNTEPDVPTRAKRRLSSLRAFYPSTFRASKLGELWSARAIIRRASGWSSSGDR